jgi:hypothetical protein
LLLLLLLLAFAMLAAKQAHNLLSCYTEKLNSRVSQPSTSLQNNTPENGAKT